MMLAIVTLIALFALFADASSCFPFRRSRSHHDFAQSLDRRPPLRPDLLVIDDQRQTHLEPCERLRMDMYAANVPNPGKAAYNGDDAYFISHDKQIFSINDGVSGSASAELLCFPNAVSRILSLAIIESFTATSDWRSSMNNAITELQKKRICGTTTAIVARKLSLAHRNIVAVYNLGDSRVAHLHFNPFSKLYELVALTDIQKYGSGNHPYQITGDKKVFAGFGVEDMEEYNFEVENDDLIIGASDGLWEVVDVNDVVQIANRVSVDSLAGVLARQASAIRQQRNLPDDITVVVGHIAWPNLRQTSSDKNNYCWAEHSLHRSLKQLESL